MHIHLKMSFYYPLTGGLTLSSCIYHLLSFNGDVLGISGIFGSSITKAATIFQRKWVCAQNSEDTAKAPPTLNSKGLVPNDITIKTSTLSDKTKRGQYWELAFTAGLLGGGLMLRLFRSFLERRLGIPIFEEGFLSRRSGSPLTSFCQGH